MTPQEKYDKANCIRMSLKLNRTTDADILARLEEQDSKQGYIKRLIRADMAKLAKTMIESLPSAQPERKKGKWLHDKDDTLLSGYCSCCGWESIIMETDVADMPYCPNCGSYNGGGDDE